jgi:hypothetical protein
MMRRTWVTLASLFLLATAFSAGSKSGSKSGDQADPGTSNLVDEGTFAIFQNGQRVATETFTIRQFPASSITSSQLHLDAAKPTDPLDQSSELTLLPDGSLSRYEWKQLLPARRSVVVEPSDQVLIMHTLVNGKTTDQSFLLTPTAFILDDYFFSTREVLLWRYLASSCKPRSSGDGCDLIRARFAVLVPRRNTSAEVFIEFKGYDDTPLNGRPQHLRHFVMQTDGADWHFWLDANHKLLRISIPDASTEVLRQEK